VRVLLADDSAVVRMGLRSLLEAAPGLEVVGEAWDGDGAVRLARELVPDVVLLDVQMPGRDGVSAARDIAPPTRILMMTFTKEPTVIREAMAAGAVGYLVHGSFDAADLATTVRSVARGASVLSGEALSALRPQEAALPPVGTPGQPGPAGPAGHAGHGLSERQHEIMDLVSGGLTNREIAARLYLAEKTVKNHVNHIFAALGVRSRGEAIALWLGSRPAYAVEEPMGPGPRPGAMGPGMGLRARREGR
jgi:DNA-binding NarL/FixJ family response regulator